MSDAKIVFTDEDGNEFTQSQLDEAEAKAMLNAELTEENESNS